MSEWSIQLLSSLIVINAHSIGKDWQYENCLYLDTGSITRGIISSIQNIKKKIFLVEPSV